ncbi:hypothetical protein Kpol_1008p21 [Vanderwaltozyma polyspora DSM 70294]|uniref:Arrestin C-terminal-like domain-containing protein n=1 Tax=Vanderwaltozyma polyspora (strain ATCC 22028 / DSM 70294 / BCRC 21397 / CBS 2163 / NBRC 10782 / NRRL Y-8283 / UCD 57-17) TaxID=436907 RepID=A7TPY5_VANPO|nr:uncharacterized protein Kpol_1008p21 [Vanderwaltozyma polyspora DSM 70294]EDO15683.1 hypothetical protein Kpol_1008p21 [Vanderwaltozyma polyspora DSM 70294]
MFSHSKINVKDPVLFDIRLHDPEDGVIVMKGPGESAPSVLISGTIVLSVLSPISIKALKLSLIGKLCLNILDDQNPHGTKKYTRFCKNFFEHKWDDFNLENYLQNNFNDFREDASNDTDSKSGNSIELNRRSKSSVSLKKLPSKNDQGYRTFIKGNYEFPFSAILPGSLTESVEGLPNASVTYTLRACLQKAKTHYNVYICTKHVRIVRTLCSDVVELSETVAVDNKWPGKVEYTISAPSKAVAIGSSTPINMLLVPLLKGLKLGPIKIALVESSQFCGNFGTIINQERIVTKMKVKDPLNYASENINPSNEEDSEFKDRWELDLNLPIPASLSKCTQDCSILRNIKVRHKLKFVIPLINPDKHVSELRASLPIQLFVSPFIPLAVRNFDESDIDKHHHKDVDISITDKGPGFDNDVIFNNLTSDLDITHAGAATNIDGNVPNSMVDLLSPPNYDKHIYDRVLSGTASGVNTPLESGTQTPVTQSEMPFPAVHSGIQSPSSNTGINSLSDIRSINIQNFDKATDRINRNYYAPGITINNGDLTGNVPGNTHIAGSPLNPNIMSKSLGNISSLFRPNEISSPKKEWSKDSISRVPSYDFAMKSTTLEEDLPPVYPRSGNDVQVTGKKLIKPKTLRLKSYTSMILGNDSHAQSTEVIKKSSSVLSGNQSMFSSMDLKLAGDSINVNSSANSISSGIVGGRKSLSSEKSPEILPIMVPPNDFSTRALQFQAVPSKTSSLNKTLDVESPPTMTPITSPPNDFSTRALQFQATPSYDNFDTSSQNRTSSVNGLLGFFGLKDKK